MFGSHEKEIIALAAEAIGPDETILGAGFFGISNLIVASTVGSGAGAVAGADFGTALTVLSSITARHVAVNAAAAAQGMTVRLIVAVTPTTIHVLNEHPGPQLTAEVARFARNSVNVSIKNFGLSRILTIADTESDASLELHGTVSWLSPHAEGDKIVFDLLDPNAH